MAGQPSSEPRLVDHGDLDLAALAASGEERVVELWRGDDHRFHVHLPADHILRLRVEQRGVDVVVSLATAAGEVDADHPVADRAPELLLADAGAGGAGVLRLRAWSSRGSRQVAIRVETLRPATQRDRRAAAAFRELRAAAAVAKERPDEALRRWDGVLTEWKRLHEPAFEGLTRVRIAAFHATRKDWRSAEQGYAAAAAAFARAGEPGWEAVAHSKTATARMQLDDAEGAVEEYGRALALAVPLGDVATEGEAHRGLGQAHRRLGHLQAALDEYERGLEVTAPDAPERGSLLSNLGVLRARFLGDVEGGRELLEEARDMAFRRPRDRSVVYQQLGQLAFEDGRLDEATTYLHRALDLLADAESCDRPVNLARLALVESARRTPARNRIDELQRDAFAEVARFGCAFSDVTVRRLAAETAERLGDTAQARDAYLRCAERYAARADREGRADCLAGAARALHRLGDDGAALARSGAALDLLQLVRPSLLRNDLRMSYFEARQVLVDFHLSRLLDQGRDAEAWALAESARARVLGDLLREAAVGPRRGVDPGLVERERSLRRRLNAAEERRFGAEAEAEQTAAARRVEALIEQLETVRGEMRRSAGAGDLAADLAARPVADLGRTADELRAALPDGALLLELRLGREASTLWAVDRETVEAHRLPSRDELETVAREARAWLSAADWPGFQPPPVCELSRLLLAPVAPRLAGRPLLVVADGVLETVPFAALPDPAADCPAAPPLVAGHRVSSLPSAATLPVLRARGSGRRPAAGWLAVVADPIYDRGDPRLAPPAVDGGGARGGNGSSPRTRDDVAAAAPDWRRLPFAGREAKDLLALAPPDRVLTALGAAASKARVTGGELTGYRLLHFATHGLLDAEHPLLSRLALSRFDAAGSPRDGALHAHEIYGLDLHADLVVLSACDTALGRQVRGEGLVAGLPRAFLSAGAARVLVSLWAVEDRGTRDLMQRFYAGLLRHGLPPTEALRRAQLDLWRRNEPPYRWAGFVLQGDPGPLAPFDD